MSKIFLVQHILENGCEDIESDKCPIRVGSCHLCDIKEKASQWLADHPETQAKPAPDPRRYEIAKAVMAAIVTCPDSCTLDPIDVSKAAVKWADALIVEMDKEAAK